MPYVDLGPVRTWYESHGSEGPLPPDASEVARMLAVMHASSPTFTEADLAAVSVRTLVMAGDTGR
jgi:hypothetical protein